MYQLIRPVNTFCTHQYCFTTSVYDWFSDDVLVVTSGLRLVFDLSVSYPYMEQHTLGKSMLNNYFRVFYRGNGKQNSQSCCEIDKNNKSKKCDRLLFFLLMQSATI